MLFATGGNRTAAEMCGISTPRVKTLCFVFTSFMAGVSGLLLMSGLPIPSGDPIIGYNLQLPIILGVMLGGVSLYGGRGSAVGTAIGVILMQVVYSGMVIARFSADYQIAVLALLLLVAASVDVVTHYRRES
jgi:ribose/xylose/arabinose/galactoside ABC-type transport system permease subunit